MKYSEYDLNVISEATLIASRYLDTAYNLMCMSIEKYFEQEGREELKYDADYRPEVIENSMMAILDIMLLAKRELDVFANPESPELKFYLKSISEKQNIVDFLTTSFSAS